MNLEKIMKSFWILAALLVCLAWPGLSPAATSSLDADILSLEPGAKPPEVYHYPDIKPAITLGVGFASVLDEDSLRTPFNEYRFMKDSVTYSLDGRVFSYPDRFMVDALFKNRHDFYGDASYAYRNLFLIRGVNSTLWHNLDNIRLYDPSDFAENLDSADRRYGIDSSITRGYARLKMPDFPAHLVVEYLRVGKDGTRQQRYILPQASIGGVSRARYVEARARDLRLLTEEYSVGLNSHLGPVEAEYTYSRKQMTPGGEDVMFDSTGRATEDRAIGSWPHNRIPELESAKHTLKLHTNYTGRIVASATLSQTESQNVFSDTKSDSSYFAGSVMWMPSTDLMFTTKYRYRSVEHDTPRRVVVTEETGADTYETQNPVRPNIDFKDNTFNLSGRYRPLNWLTLRAGYTYDKRDRKTDSGSMKDWWPIVPKSTEKDEFNLGADLLVTKRYKAKLAYVHTAYDNPSHAAVPDSADMFKGVLTLMPIPSVYAVLGYDRTIERRSDIEFEESDFKDNAKRNVTKDHVTAIASWMITPGVTLSGHYAFFNHAVQEDILVNLAGVGASIAHDQDWDSTVQVYGAGVQYVPFRNLRLNAGVTWVDTKSSFKYDPEVAWQGDMTDATISSWSKVRTLEETWSVGASWDLPDNFHLGVDYKFNTFDQRADNGYDDLKDGSVHLVMVTLKKTLGGGM